jgi:hypothetical protein
MAAVKIRVGGRSTGTPAPAAKRGAKPAKRAAAKPAKRASTGRGPGRPRKAEGEPVTRRASKNIDPRTEARLLKAVEKAGERRAKAEAEHKEAINALHAAAVEAIEEGVTMAKVSDVSGISRQWLYKMGDFADRGGVVTTGSTNGGGDGGSRPAKRTAKARPAKRASARTRTSTATPRNGGSRRRVAIRSAG